MTDSHFSSVSLQRTAVRFTKRAQPFNSIMKFLLVFLLVVLVSVSFVRTLPLSESEGEDPKSEYEEATTVTDSEEPTSEANTETETESISTEVSTEPPVTEPEGTDSTIVTASDTATETETKTESSTKPGPTMSPSTGSHACHIKYNIWMAVLAMIAVIKLN